MNILQIGGFNMRVGDGSQYWSLKDRLAGLGHSVRQREAIGYGMGIGPNSCQPIDLMWAESVLGYSDGWATYKMIEHGIFAHGQDSVKNKKIVVAVAGVPDAFFGQFGGPIWHIYDAIGYGFAFNVTDTPTSYGLLATKDHAVTSIDISLFDAQDVMLTMIAGSSASRLNVNCDGLFPAIMLPSAKHQQVCNHPKVLDALASLFT